MTKDIHEICDAWRDLEAKKTLSRKEGENYPQAKAEVRKAIRNAKEEYLQNKYAELQKDFEDPRLYSKSSKSYQMEKANMSR